MAVTAALLPDDATLTEEGLHVPGAGPVLLIACGALAHEVLALKRLNGWDHMDLQCLPAKLHLYPDQITVEVARAVTAANTRTRTSSQPTAAVRTAVAAA